LLLPHRQIGPAKASVVEHGSCHAGGDVWDVGAGVPDRVYEMVLALRLHQITHGTEVKAFQDDLVGINVRKDDHPVAGHYDLFNSQ